MTNQGFVYALVGFLKIHPPHPVVHPSDPTPSDVGATPSDRRCPKYKRKNHKNKTLFSPFWLKTGSYFWFNY